MKRKADDSADGLPKAKEAKTIQSNDSECLEDDPERVLQSGGSENLRQVQAIRISCNGERKAGAPRMIQYNIPSDHDVFRKGSLSGLSNLVGIQMNLCMVWSSPSPDVSPGAEILPVSTWHYQNSEAERLMNLLHPEFAQHFPTHHKDGQVIKSSEHWLRKASSVLVAGVDHKPLFAHHLRLLLRFRDSMMETLNFLPPGYYTDDMSELLKRPELAGKELLAASDILAQFTPREFKEFYMAHCVFNPRYLHPTPWAGSTEKFRLSNRTTKLREYAGLSLEDKFTNTDSWKERYLLAKIQELESRLKETGDRSGGGSEEMDWALIQRRIKRTLE